MKPGANLQTIVKAPNESLGKLTKKDVVVVWGTHDVGKNESEKGLRQIRNFVENIKHTNVIVMSVPYRHDLAPNSCVNHEVKFYNRKLRKHLKVHDNVCVVEVDNKRELYTRHGLHMNLKGKELIAHKIIKTIKAMLDKKKSVPIKLNYKGDLERANNVTEGVTITKEPETEQDNTKKVRQSNTETDTNPTDTLSTDNAGNRLPNRQRKATKTLSKDFLW